MSNIRIDLEATVINGQTLTFKSPVDCSQITGLKVYYPEGDAVKSRVFQFADAHGNNVGNINLFAANVLVKVILDTDLNRAYVQNADTNAYLESHIQNKENPHGVAPAQIGAATSEEMARALRVVWTKMPNKSTNYDECTDVGIYWVNMWAGTASEGNNQPPANDTGWMHVYGNADTCLIQEWHTTSNGIIVRRCVTGTWGEWEWENPPMALGVEYRTTERYNGKPVYAVLVNYGALPNNSSKSVYAFSGSFTAILSMEYTLTNWTVGIFAQASKSVEVYIVNPGNLYAKTTSDMSAYSMTVLIKYTKD